MTCHSLSKGLCDTREYSPDFRTDAAAGHPLVDTVVADPTRRDLVERAAREDLVGSTDAEQRKETHYRDHAAGTKFVPFALETYGALFERSDRFLVECATLASR